MGFNPRPFQITSVAPTYYCKQVRQIFSEGLIFASTNPQYDDRLFIEFQVHYMKIPSSEHGENILCTEIDSYIDSRKFVILEGKK